MSEILFGNEIPGVPAPGEAGIEGGRHRFLFGQAWLAHQGGCFLINDLAAAGQLGFAMSQIPAHECFKMVDIVKINIVEVLHVRVDVARDGDVDPVVFEQAILVHPNAGVCRSGGCT